MHISPSSPGALRHYLDLYTALLFRSRDKMLTRNRDVNVSGMSINRLVKYANHFYYTHSYIWRENQFRRREIQSLFLAVYFLIARDRINYHQSGAMRNYPVSYHCSLGIFIFYFCDRVCGGKQEQELPTSKYDYRTCGLAIFSSHAPHESTVSSLYTVWNRLPERCQITRYK